jgi:hypothetical protein
VRENIVPLDHSVLWDVFVLRVDSFFSFRNFPMMLPECRAFRDYSLSFRLVSLLHNLNFVFTDYHLSAGSSFGNESRYQRFISQSDWLISRIAAASQFPPFLQARSYTIVCWFRRRPVQIIPWFPGGRLRDKWLSTVSRNDLHHFVRCFPLREVTLSFAFHLNRRTVSSNVRLLSATSAMTTILVDEKLRMNLEIVKDGIASQSNFFISILFRLNKRD